MTVEQFVARLEEKGLRCERKPSGQFRCQCPAHAREDSDTNLAVDPGKYGGIVVTCHSHQCEPEAIARAVGLTLRDLMPARVTNGEGRAPPLAVYPYRGEDRTVRYEVIREADKRFWQRLPGATKGGIGNAERILFGIPELLLTRPGDLVAICEGEKDCINVAKLGIAATTNPGGAGKWRESFTEWLKSRLPGRRFVLLPDNDEPGTQHAVEVEASFKRAGLDVLTIMLPGLEPKEDVSDWISKGGTAEKLRDLAASLTEKLNRLVITGRDLQTRKFPIPESLVPNLMFRGFSTLLAGDSKLGKSSLLLRMIVAMACGGWWLDRDRRPENRLPLSRVMFINFEDPPFITQDRVLKMMIGEPIPDNLLLMEPPYGYSLRQIIEWLPGAKERFSLDAVVLDPIAVAAEWKDETDNAEIMVTFKSLQRLAAETHLSILTSHHVTKKPGERGLNIRGGGAIKANVLGYLVLEPEKELFRLHGINKATGSWDVILNREERDYSWWIEQTMTGHTRTPQQATKDQIKGDLLYLIGEAPGITAEGLAGSLEIAERTCRDYLGELAEAELIFAHDLPRQEGQRGPNKKGWFRITASD